MRQETGGQAANKMQLTMSSITAMYKHERNFPRRVINSKRGALINDMSTKKLPALLLKCIIYSW